MKRFIFLLLNIVLFANYSFIFSANNVKEKIIWKNGIAIINGIPKYILPNKMLRSRMFLSKRFIKRINSFTIKAALIDFSYNSNMKDYLLIRESNRDDPYCPTDPNDKTAIKLYYKITDNNMFVSKNGKEWDRLFLKIIDSNPKDPNIIMVIYLKCKYFSGEYISAWH
jgi:hypothetical protein